MRHAIKTLLTLLGLASLLAPVTQALAQSIPTTPGWFQIPNTKISPLCPPGVPGNTGCASVTAAWNGGDLDITRNRLIIWGGGHNDYYGNELYALDLSSLTMLRLTSPGTPYAPSSSCVTSIANGTQPNSRHTYGGVTYMPNIDRLWITGGSLACGMGSPAPGKDVWTYNFNSSATNKWVYQNPSINGISPNAPGWHAGFTSAYDPNKQVVFFHDQAYFFAYNFSSNTIQQVSGVISGTNIGQGIDYNKSAVIDPDRKLYILIGSGEVFSYDISGPLGGPSSYTAVKRSTTGANGIVSTANPGLAYDPIGKQVVAWNGGNSVSLLNTSTWTWSTVSYSGGPAAVSSGTFGRWRYSPALDVFVNVNAIDQNAYTLRLQRSSSTPTNQPPTTPTGLSGNAVSPTQISLSWSASTDSDGVAGYKVLRNSVQVGTSAATSYQDSGLSPSTSYSYAVIAYDTLGNNSSPSSSISVSTPSAPPTGGSDFSSRCAGPGVVFCDGFEFANQAALNAWLTPGKGGQNWGTLDAAIKTSGNTSLRFEIPPLSGGNPSGSFYHPFGSSDATRVGFGQNQTFYLQYRMRISPEMLTTQFGGSGWKQIIIHRYGSSCGQIELTTANDWYRGIPGMDTSCGQRGFYVDLGGDYLLQQGDYNCRYSNINPNSCFFYKANNWMTFYYEIKIGSWGQPNSTIRAWVALDGQPLKKFIEFTNYSLLYDVSASDVYDYLQLTPYMTNKDPSLNHAPAYMWFDDLIISRQPIAPPGAGTADTTPPLPPTNLTSN